MKTARRLVLGTRGSALALAQSGQTKALLESKLPGVTIELKIVKTEGDRLQQDLPDAGAKLDKGLFTKALEQALLDGSIDLAVHSLKDLPTEIPKGLVIAAIPPREDPRDALIAANGARSIAELPPNARIGTGSGRRAFQLRVQRSDLDCIPIRGNVDTRIAKLRAGEFDAIVLALAGLKRLGRESDATAILSFDEMLPAPGQGALGIEMREGADADAVKTVLDDATTRAFVDAERRVLMRIGGGCDLPLGVLAALRPDRYLPDQTGFRIEAVLFREDGFRFASGEYGTRTLAELPERADWLASELREVLSRGGRWTDPGRPRIAITRARDQAGELARTIEARGGAVDLYPVVKIEPPHDAAALATAARDLARFDAIVFTSANSVSAYCDALDRAGTMPSMSTKFVAAVGPTTRAALERRGVRVSTSGNENATALVRQIASEITGRRVLWPCGDLADGATEAALGSTGAIVTSVVVYRSVADREHADALKQALEDGVVDAVTFAAGSAVEAFVGDPERDIHDYSQQCLARAAVVVLGKTAIDALATIRVVPDAIAAEPTIEALADAAVAAGRERRRKRGRTP